MKIDRFDKSATKRHAALVFAIVLALLINTGVLAGGGAPDMTFGSAGTVTTDFGDGDAGSYGIAIQPDGKILVAGGNLLGTVAAHFALARYLSDGSLDPSFGAGGIVTTDFAAGGAAAAAVILQPDGKILVAGASSGDFALARYLSDGFLDTTFDTDGKVTTDFGGFDKVNAVALQPNGRIILAGSSICASCTISDLALARYHSDGSLDTSFDADGRVTLTMSESPVWATGLALQPDGKILASGGVTRGDKYNFALVRFNPDGSLDPIFAGDGMVITDFGSRSGYGSAVVLQPDGRIIVGGDTSTEMDANFTLVRYTSDGSVDTTFDADGKVITDFASYDQNGTAIALQPDGKIVMAGTGFGSLGADFALARYSSDGSLDTTFDTDGKVTTDFSYSADYGNAVAVHGDGRIVIAGSSNGKFALAAYTDTIFEDVSPDYWSWTWIERLFRAGLTDGCGTTPLTYCPEGSVTRAQMAVFLERGIHGASFVPPPVGSLTGFLDVPLGHWAAAWIRKLATEGITSGCRPNYYCPEAPVTRAEMAVFLLKARYGSAYTPPAVGGGTGFSDVAPTYWAAAWIKQLAAEGITGGCGTGTYCPDAPVTRAQMAVFLVRAFNLP